jgi:hypothetical protein
VCFGFELSHFLRKFAALLRKHLAVYQDAAFLHVQKHRHKRLFNLLVDLAQRRLLSQLLPKRFVQLQRDVSIFRRVRSSRFEIDLVEGELLGAFARDVLVVNRLFSQVVSCHRVHVVARRNAVKNIGLD